MKKKVEYREWEKNGGNAGLTYVQSTSVSAEGDRTDVTQTNTT